MLLVKTDLKPSRIHGLGCFAVGRISRGSVVWIFDERIDVRIHFAKLANLPQTAERFFLRYGYVELRDGEKVVTLCGDHAKYMNHADQPNVIESGTERQENVAARDIEAGEELTCNYFLFDLDAERKLSGAFDRE